MSTLSRLAVVGTGTTGYRRQQDVSQYVLAARAVRAALDDAGLEPGDVDGLVTEAGIGTLHEDLLSQACGIRPQLSAQWLVGAAGTVGAPQLVAPAVAAGQASVVVVVQVVGGSDLHLDPYAYHARDEVKSGYEMPMGWFGQAVYFAAMAARYAHEHGLPEESLAQVAIQARRAAALTPGAQRPEPIDLEDYRASRGIATPLRSPDCALISEGATAYVLTTVDRARDLRQPVVSVAGTGVHRTEGNQSTWFTQRDDYLATGAAESGRQAYRQADVGPGDIDVVELYDCFSITPLLQLEDLGLRPRGGAATSMAAGEHALDGVLPLNTHGGLLAYGFCLGISHLVEAVAQLRGTRGAAQVADAEVALVGGLGVPHHATTILTKGA